MNAITARGNARKLILPFVRGFLLFAIMIIVGIPASAASSPSRTFSFSYIVEIPAPNEAGPVEIFIPLAVSDGQQEIIKRTINTSVLGSIKTESKDGNHFWHGRVAHANGEPIKVQVDYLVRRDVFMKSPVDAQSEYRPEELKQLAPFLKPDARVPVDHPIVNKILADLKFSDQSTMGRARAIYDYVVDNMEYKKIGTGWGNGDTFWACSAKYGNCTDFHALFISLARTNGIPARFEIGFPVPEDRSQGTIGGYHCWVQFFAPGIGWFPIDASEARKNPDKRDLFFGTHPTDRIEFTVGRDLQLGEGHTTGPLNYFIYPHVEIGGQQFKEVKTRFEYRDIEAVSVPHSEKSVKLETKEQSSF